MKKVMAVLLTLAVMFSLSVCVYQPKSAAVAAVNDEPSFKLTKDWKIGATVFTISNAWMPIAMEALKREADKYGAKVDIFSAEGSVSDQISQIENMIAADYDAILVSAVSTAALDEVLTRALEADIFVMSYQNPVENPDIASSRIYCNEYEWAVISAEWLCKALNYEGKIVCLQGQTGNQLNEKKRNGAMSVFEKYDGIEILAEADTNWAQPPAEAAMQQWVAAFPQIDGVFTQCGASALGAYNVLNNNDMPIVPIVGEDLNGWLKIWANNRDKGFSSIGVAVPEYISAVALNATLRALEGHAYPVDLELPMPEITDDNVMDYVKLDGPDEMFVCDQISSEEMMALLGPLTK